MSINSGWITTSSGLKIPRLLYGTAWKKEHTSDLVVKALQAGFTGIDTACQPKHYNEPQVGEAIERVKEFGIEREKIFIQTKFTPLNGQDPNQIPYDKNAPIELQVAQSFEVSKKNLQTKYVDSLVLHSPIFPHSELMLVWNAMERIYEDEGALQLGISNCYDLNTLQKLYSDSTVKPTILQNRFYNESGYDIDLRNWCSDNGIIYQSFWSLTANPYILNSKSVVEIAKAYSKTVEQIFFRFLSQSNIVPLTGTTSQKHMIEDLSIFEFELTTNELEIIKSLLK